MLLGVLVVCLAARGWLEKQEQAFAVEGPESRIDLTGIAADSERGETNGNEENVRPSPVRPIHLHTFVASFR